MQKIYVLLRNDKQTGPYSLEEIIQFDLKPYDLIWIEGKSAGWYYPQEIGALHPYLQFLPQKPKPVVQTTTASPVFVAMPSAPRVDAVQPAPLQEAPVIAAETSTRSSGAASKNLEEAIYAQFTAPAEKQTVNTTTTIPAKQKKRGSVTVAGGVMAVLVVGGVFAASWMLNRHNYDDTVTPEPALTAPASAEISSTAVAKTDDTKNTVTNAGQKRRQQRTSAASGRTVPVTKQAVSQKQKTVTVSPAEEANNGHVSTAPPQEEPVTKKEESTAAPAGTTAPQETKKKLRDKILDLFKKKPGEQKSEEAKPADNNNSERTATHREAGANLAQMVSIRFDIPNDWMMGIKGAKAILVNRGSEKISKATVEVLYYNDDNELLQKKVINFSKIDGKESQTIAIPDHATATRVDYNVLSVTGSGQPSA
ncbi:hypothetical protein [Flavisolibacter nicotianae]|uniref:hypothetical protein n=1 Tax=Flavisolibacter nicotianae TaxID=2364882 RepID=UPI000EACC5F6|nr:hypothetical protein [Flavisolibacter nicotianae]